MTTFTTLTDGPLTLTLEATALEVTVETEPGLCEATIELTGPDEVLAEARSSRNGTHWTLTVPAPDPGPAASRGSVVMVGDITGSVVMSSSGSIHVNGNTVVNGQMLGDGPEPVRARILIPNGSNLNVPRMHAGDVRAAGIYDAVVFRSTNAELHLDHARTVEADSTNGDIAIGSASELIEAATTNGDITTGSAPHLRARASNGDIRVLLHGDHRIDAHTDNGDISVHRLGHTGAQVSTSTRNGRERLL